jgi:uncharacterized protein (TIGR02246 family)
MMFVCATALAQAPNNADVHNALRRLKVTMEKALNERDMNTILANVAPSVVFTTMNGDVCFGRDAVKAYFNKMMNAPGHIVQSINTHFEADALTLLYGDDTGIAFGSSNDHYVLTNGQKFDIRGRWTCTLVKMDGRWLIGSFHYSASIFDNPILTKMRAILLSGGAIAVVIALIIGIIVGRATTAKKAKA